MNRTAIIIIIVITTLFRLKAQDVVVSGIIPNYKERPIGLAYFEDYLDNERRVAAKTVTGKDGSFILEFEWTRAWPAFLILENETLEMFLVPGDSVKIKGKHKKLAGTSEFSGKGCDANQYLSQHLVKFTGMRRHMDKKQKKADILQLLALHDTMYNREMKAFLTFSEGKGPEFYLYMHSHIEYFYANRLMVYELSRSEIEMRMQKIEINNENALNSVNYIYFLENYLKFITGIRKAEMKGKIENFWSFQFDLIREYFSGWVMDILLAKLINSTFNYTTIITTQSLLNKYYNIYKNQVFYKRLEKRFNDKNRNY